MSGDETYELEEVVIAAETELAYLFRLSDADPEDAEDGEDQWWIPKSLIISQDVYNKNEEGYVEIPMWFAEKEGIV